MKRRRRRRRGRGKTPSSKRKKSARKVFGLVMKDLKRVVITGWFVMNVIVWIVMVFFGRLSWGLLWNRKGHEESDDEGYGHGYGDNDIDVEWIDLIFMCLYTGGICVIFYCIWRLPYFLYFRNVKSFILPLYMVRNWIQDTRRRILDVIQELFYRIKESWNEWKMTNGKPKNKKNKNKKNKKK